MAARAQDTIPVPSRFPADSALFLPQADTLVKQDTLTKTAEKKDKSINAEVKYNAADSMVYSLDLKKVYLYTDAKVTFLDKELTAAYIEFDMTTNEVFAEGMPDSTGKITGRPNFKDGDQQIEAHRLRYNFKTQKGFIETVRTEQEGGFLHAEKTKKEASGVINLKNGKYTTCDAEHPHFYIALTKAKSIPGDKIVSGPAYLVIEDIPIPIGIPFGFFPNTKTNTSGVIIPSYGEEATRGFYLQNGGYYWAVNDHMDLKITGDIYTNGTWGIRGGSQYRKRYRFNGNLDMRYFKNVSGTRGLEDYGKSFDYSINWSHNQDAKANPNQQFRASVNLSTSGFDRNHSRVLTNALTNTKSSSISYQRTFPNTPFNFSVSANHSQNSNTGAVDLNLPRANMSMSRISPFKSLNKTGRKKWYEDIQLSYTSSLDNRINTNDSLMFTRAMFRNSRNGFQHEVPLYWNYKPKKLKTLTITPSFRYKGVAYTERISKSRELFVDSDTSYYRTKTDTIKGLTYAHAYYPSIGLGLAPKIYGMYTFRPGSSIQAVRHVMSPSVSFTYIPDVSTVVPEYYRTLYDENGKQLERYSILGNGIYGTPTLGRSVRTMSFRLNNNVEAKMWSKNDTAQDVKKVSIIDNLSFSSNMNFDDSIKFTPIAFNGNTRLLNGKLNIAFRGSMDPYAEIKNVSNSWVRVNRSELSETGKLLRLTNAGFSTGFTFQGGSKKKDTQAPQREPDPIANTPGTLQPGMDEYNPLDEGTYGGYVDFNIPWSLRIDYNFDYTNRRRETNIIQTVRLSGDFSLTPKWKIGYNSGYDFKLKKVTTTNLSIYRDLHCWEMRLTAVPFGIYKSFNFQINVRSAILQDLKYDKRIPWQDNF